MITAEQQKAGDALELKRTGQAYTPKFKTVDVHEFHLLHSSKYGRQNETGKNIIRARFVIAWDALEEQMGVYMHYSFQDGNVYKLVEYARDLNQAMAIFKAECEQNFCRNNLD